jgi:hypothetical protein
MATAKNPKLLLVEGRDDLFVVAEVFEKSTGKKWKTNPGQRLIDIEWCGSDDGILKNMGVKWKESGRKIVGVVIDADNSSGSRWQSVCSHAPTEVSPGLPDELPPDGLVLTLERERRFGVWIMPDNQTVGMMETFLKSLRTTMPAELGAHVVLSMNRAREIMSEYLVTHPNTNPSIKPWKETHADKAEFHTWLAWQDPPGLQLHEAVMHQLLDVQAPLAQKFVAWMNRLYF